MKKTKMRRILACVMSMVLILCAVPMAAVAAEEKGIYYGFEYTIDLDAGFVTIDGYTGTETVLNVPAEIGGYPVTAIGDRAFAYETTVKEINLPDSVNIMGDEVFYGCIKLENIAIEVGIPAAGDNMFYDCRRLNNVELADGVEYIGAYAFYNCVIDELEIPESVKAIGEYAFSKSNVGEIVIPEGVTVIEEGTFKGCEELATVTLPESLLAIGDYAFSRTSMLEEITIPEGTVSIGNNAFEYCTSLKTVTMADSVTSLGRQAFRVCVALESAKLSEGLTRIPAGAFITCKSLEEIDIPDNVTEIGASAFSGCSAIKKADLPASLENIDSAAFNGCSSLAEIVIPDGCKNIYSYAFAGCTALASIAVPDSVVYLGYLAVDATAYAADEANWTDGVLYIGKHLVKADKSLEGTYEVLDGTVSISERAFAESLGVTELIIPSSVEYIGDYVATPKRYNQTHLLARTVYEGTPEMWDEIDMKKNTPAWNTELLANLVFDTGIIGDVVCDGVLTSEDVLALFKYLADETVLDDIGVKNADVNGDGTVNAKDLLILRRMMVA